MAATYEGFSKGQKLFVVSGAIFAVFVSLVFAAWIMDGALRNMQFNQSDQEVVNRLLGDTTDPQHKSILRAHAIDAVANLKQLANRQSIVVVAFAGAFALCAIGFALFLLGADSALRLQTEQGRSGIKLLLAGTAPGMMCFVLAIVLAGMAVVHRSSVNPAPVNFPRQVMGSIESPAPRALADADAGSKAEPSRAKEAAEQRNADREAQNRAAEKAAAAKAAVEKVAADKLMATQLLATQAAAAKAAAEKAAVDKLAIEKSAADKLAAEKSAVDKLAADKAVAAEKATAAKVKAAKAATEKAAIDKLAAEKSAADKLAAAKAADKAVVAEKAAAARLTAAKAAAVKSEADKVSAAKLAADRAAAERLANDKVRADAADADKLAADRAASSKLAADKAAADKLAADRAAADRLATNKAASDTARADKAATDRVDSANLIAEKISASGTPSEIYKRALILRSDGETGRALALLRYASFAGHGPSSRLLAAIYRDGAPDVRANFRQAERYQALADAQGER